MERVSETRDAVDRRKAAEEGGRPGWATPFLAGVLLVAAFGLAATGLVAVFQVTHSETVFPGVRVGDVAVGGMTREEALAELRPLFETRRTSLLSMRVADLERKASLADLGASFDAAAAVEAAYEVGRTGGWMNRLATQAGALAQGYSVESPGLRLDRSKLQSYLAQQAREVDRPVKDAALVIGDDLSVRVTPSVVGRKLDVAGAAAAIERAMATGIDSLTLPVEETQPKRVERDLEEARASVSTILSGPVSLEFEGRKWSLSQKEIAAALSVDLKEGLPSPVVSLRDAPLKQLVDRMASEIDQPKTNARFDWNGGKVKPLRDGQDGRKLDTARAILLLKGAISSQQRVVSLPVDVDKAVRSSVDPSTLGIKERVEFGRTTVAGVPEKVYNIKLAASRLNGVMLAPGDIFSFNRELGPTTLKAGFQTGFGISVSNGQMETVPSVAGGICQVATTLLHAVFWGGYQIEERYSHLYWIPNYGRPPRGLVGLDATVDDPSLDLKFINNTDNYLLIQSIVADGALEFSLYGTKPTWKVDVDGPIITNVVKADPKAVRQEEPSWPEGREVWVESATDGMDVDIVRKVSQGGDVRTLHLRSKYQPSRNVLMVGTKKAEPTPGPTAVPGATSPSPTPAAGATTPGPAVTPGPTTPATSGPVAPQASPTRPAGTAPAAGAASTPAPPAATPRPPAQTAVPTAAAPRP